MALIYKGIGPAGNAVWEDEVTGEIVTRDASFGEGLTAGQQISPDAGTDYFADALEDLWAEDEGALASAIEQDPDAFGLSAPGDIVDPSAFLTTGDPTEVFYETPTDEGSLITQADPTAYLQSGNPADIAIDSQSLYQPPTTPSYEPPPSIWDQGAYEASLQDPAIEMPVADTATGLSPQTTFLYNGQEYELGEAATGESINAFIEQNPDLFGGAAQTTAAVPEPVAPSGESYTFYGVGPDGNAVFRDSAGTIQTFDAAVAEGLNPQDEVDANYINTTAAQLPATQAPVEDDPYAGVNPDSVYTFYGIGSAGNAVFRNENGDMRQLDPSMAEGLDPGDQYVMETMQGMGADGGQNLQVDQSLNEAMGLIDEDWYTDPTEWTGEIDSKNLDMTGLEEDEYRDFRSRLNSLNWNYEQGNFGEQEYQQRFADLLENMNVPSVVQGTDKIYYMDPGVAMNPYDANIKGNFGERPGMYRTDARTDGDSSFSDYVDEIATVISIAAGQPWWATALYAGGASAAANPDDLAGALFDGIRAGITAGTIPAATGAETDVIYNLASKGAQEAGMELSESELWRVADTVTELASEQFGQDNNAEDFLWESGEEPEVPPELEDPWQETEAYIQSLPPELRDQAREQIEALQEAQAPGAYDIPEGSSLDPTEDVNANDAELQPIYNPDGSINQDILDEYLKEQGIDINVLPGIANPDESSAADPNATDQEASAGGDAGNQNQGADQSQADADGGAGDTSTTEQDLGEVQQDTDTGIADTAELPPEIQEVQQSFPGAFVVFNNGQWVDVNTGRVVQGAMRDWVEGSNIEPIEGAVYNDNGQRMDSDEATETVPDVENENTGDSIADDVPVWDVGSSFDPDNPQQGAGVNDTPQQDVTDDTDSSTDDGSGESTDQGPADGADGADTSTAGDGQDNVDGESTDTGGDGQDTVDVGDDTTTGGDGSDTPSGDGADAPTPGDGGDAPTPGDGVDTPTPDGGADGPVDDVTPEPGEDTTPGGGAGDGSGDGDGDGDGDVDIEIPEIPAGAGRLPARGGGGEAQELADIDQYEFTGPLDELMKRYGVAASKAAAGEEAAQMQVDEMDRLIDYLLYENDGEGRSGALSQDDILEMLGVI